MRYYIDDLSDPGQNWRCWPWKSKVYARVFFPIWPLLLGGLEPVVADGRYAADVVQNRVPAAVEALADRTSPEDQETFLEAVDRPFVELVGPIEPGCRCRYCRWAHRMQQTDQDEVREATLRACFVQVVSMHLELILSEPKAYDRWHGAPRLIRRYRHLLARGD